MAFKWREDHTPRVLTLLQERPSLWNPKAPEYKLKNARDEALQAIVDELNLPGVTPEAIKLKIKTIRTRYSAELTKIIRSLQDGVANKDIYTPKLFWFKQADSFLRTVCMARNSGTKRSTSVLTRRSREQDTEEISNQEESGEQTTTTRHTRDAQNLRTLRKRACTPTSSVGTSVETAIEQLGQIKVENASAEHEFDYFCKSIAIQLKNMPLDRALICQEKIQKVMTDERMFQFRTQQMLISSQENCESNNNANVQVSISNPFTVESYSAET